METDKLEVYRAGFRERSAREKARRVKRREAAWRAARRAAEVLRTRYGAERILVFGSLARGDDFVESSDVDLLAWGVAWGREFSAVAEIAAIDDEIEVNLVIGELARLAILSSADVEGVEL